MRAQLTDGAAIHHRGQRAPAFKIVQLIDALGLGKAATTLGVSTTTLCKARSTGEAAKSLELAAEGALRLPIARVKAPPARGASKPLVKAAFQVLETAAAGAEAILKAKATDTPAETVLCLVELTRDDIRALEPFVLARGGKMLVS